MSKKNESNTALNNFLSTMWMAYLDELLVVDLSISIDVYIIHFERKKSMIVCQTNMIFGKDGRSMARTKVAQAIS